MTWVREQAVEKATYQSLDCGYTLKVELTDVADGQLCKTKGGIRG